MMSTEKMLDYFMEQTHNSLNDIKSDQKLMQEKIDTLLQFKWQIIGASAVISILVSILFSALDIVSK